jgi:hypothetical protein
MVLLRNMQRVIEAHEYLGAGLALPLEESLAYRRPAEHRGCRPEDLSAGSRETRQRLAIDHVIARIFVEPYLIHRLALPGCAVHLERLEPDDGALAALPAQRRGVNEIRDSSGHRWAADDVVQRDQPCP